MADDRPTAVLLISCRDQPGIVAAMGDFVYRHGGNIVRAEQHFDREDDVFFQRVEFEIGALEVRREQIAADFSPIAERFEMDYQIRFTDEVQRIAILVSKQPHCLDDLLSRWRMADFGAAEVPLVISNHPDHADRVEFLGPEYVHLPVTPESRAEQEAEMLALFARHRIDLIVLARYMQILSAEFIQRSADGFADRPPGEPAPAAGDRTSKFPSRIINIHHSFLPAFLGARPYHQAHARGVKIVGATAHYATEDLDEGPIIEQEVMRVSHRDSVDDLVREGRDLERTVLARAVQAHLEHRVLRFGRRTVVFE